MQELQQVFNYGMNEVRTVIKDGEPWFVAKDVCDVLELSDTNKALLVLDEDEKCKHEQYSGSGRKPMIINEAGLYTLIIRSRKPEAKAFKRWITHEVIPSIRKHGAYMTENTLEQAINNPDFMIGLLTNLKEEKRKRIEAEEKAEVLFKSYMHNQTNLSTYW
ncbi:BRO-N domain-containing protein [Niallia sp. 03133]|uniref:BRO-N domain-containing protein n=1 Tax=Niallia sp. 03133 TaxID=3458060 RepID=UPI00404460DC